MPALESAYRDVVRLASRKHRRPTPIAMLVNAGVR